MFFSRVQQGDPDSRRVGSRAVKAWITFSAEESATEALKRQDQLVCGHPITIAYAKRVKSTATLLILSVFTPVCRLLLPLQ